MNDRFKFRYYNKFAKQMIYPCSYEKIESIYETLKQQELWDCAIDVPIAYNHIKKSFLVFMQCTGLKDENGKLIYEGDILLSPDTECPYMVLVDWFDEEAKFVVNAWNGKEFEYLLSDDEPQDLENFEIIGNIYENADLLEMVGE